MRFYTEAQRVNKGDWKPSEFVNAIFGQSEDWSDWQAAFWIFSEDGGLLPFEEFMKEAPQTPIPYKEKRTPWGIDY